MKLRKIRLQNIKSYVDQEIKFNDGVNFISGINGAGKSTIIEAVGYALFDYNPGTVSDFVRYGAKTGIITIEFAALDEREYRVVRKMGGTNSWVVFDVESGGELDLHGSRDVKAWLKEAFGVDQDMELEQLFRDIVGVPQGTFVAPFLETPSLRKKKFDTVLKVEQYRDAYFNTRGCVKLIEDNLREGDKVLAVLAAEVKDFDVVREQVQLLTQKVRELIEEQQKNEARVKEANTHVAALEKIKAELDSTMAELKALQGSLQALTVHRKDLEKNLAQAVQAFQTLEQVSKGYQAYLELAAKVKELEKQKQEKERLERELSKVSQEAAALAATIQSGDRELAARETEIERENQQIEQRLGELKTTLNNLRKEHKELLDKQERFVRWQKHEEEMAQVVTQLQTVHREVISKNQLLRGALAEEEAGIRERLQLLPQIKSEAAQLESAEQNLTNTREEYARLRERLQALQGDSQQAADGLCPFLKSPCQNVDGDLGGYFRERISEVQREMAKLKELGTQRAEAVKKATQAKEQLILLQADEKRLQQLVNQKTALQTEIQTMFKKASALPGPGVLADLQKICPVPLQREEFLQAWNNWGDENNLDGVITIAESIVEKSRAHRSSGEKELTETVNISSNNITKYNTEEESLLKSVQQLQIKTQVISQEKVELQKIREKGMHAEETLKKLAAELENYKAVESNLERTKGDQERYFKDYEVYMHHKAEAAKRDALQSEVERITAEVIARESQVQELEEKRIELAEGFAPEELERAKHHLDELKQAFSAQAQVLQERKQDLLEYDDRFRQMTKKMLEMEKAKEKMRIDRQTLRLLEMVRGILNQAGGPIARVYLENISREANEIYRQISSENAILGWQPDYDITLTDVFQSQERRRTFKQFSGGEQMTAALAVRLALLKQQSMVRVGFFDEPTANLDTGRRSNLAETIPRVTGDFDQLFIISHDDTFDSVTDNIIQLKKDTENGSGLE